MPDLLQDVPSGSGVGDHRTRPRSRILRFVPGELFYSERVYRGPAGDTSTGTGAFSAHGLFWTYRDVEPSLLPEPDPEIRKPLITAIGAGGTYPDYVPAPYIVSDKRDGVDVVTVVTEVPLSYSGVKVKIDTDLPVGEEGATVRYDGRVVGMVETEEYGSKILAVGGVNRLTGKAGFAAARAVAAIANREAIRLTVKNGAKLDIQVGKPPVIDGHKAERMRVGCGSATAGLFAEFFKEAADEIIVLDSHITSVFTHHTAGRFLGLTPSGIEPKFRLSTPGRYFGNHGDGWGGTDVHDPLDIIASVDMSRTAVGTTLLITETTGQKAAMFRLNEDGVFAPMELDAGSENRDGSHRRNLPGIPCLGGVRRRRGRFR